mmetsp:Transcript_26156/g.69478  ORF Transcript_26156/g.69478 Transcript_26156/m.69478 type:complete len:160 (+) Transcript_26156:191-670(+)
MSRRRLVPRSSSNWLFFRHANLTDSRTPPLPAESVRFMDIHPIRCAVPAWSRCMTSSTWEGHDARSEGELLGHFPFCSAGLVRVSDFRGALRSSAQYGHYGIVLKQARTCRNLGLFGILGRLTAVVYIMSPISRATFMGISLHRMKGQPLVLLLSKIAV